MTSAAPGRLLPVAMLAAMALMLCTASTRACGLNVGPGSTVTISSTLTTDCVTIAAGGKIVIAAGGTLVLNGSNGNDVSTIDGRLELQASTSTLRISTNDHTMTGAGSVIGEHNSATIDITSAVTVTIDTNLTVCGAMEIQGGSGTLVNNGTVLADDATTASTRDRLECYSGTFSGSGEWKVDTANAFLTFRSGVTATGLTGAVTVSAGTLDINEDVCTTGDLSFTGGKIDVEAGDTFQAGGTCP